MGWFEIPAGGSIEGIYISPSRFEANFSICLEKSRPGLMPLINIRDKPTQPGLSPFPTGNTCKPRLARLCQPPPRSPKESQLSQLSSNSISPGTNYLPWSDGLVSLEGGIGAEAINRRKISVPWWGGKRRWNDARAIDSKSDYEGTWREGDVVWSWLNYSFGIEIKRRGRDYLYLHAVAIWGEYRWPGGVDT